MIKFSFLEDSKGGKTLFWFKGFDENWQIWSILTLNLILILEVCRKNTSEKIRFELTPEDLVTATSEVAARFKIGVVPQTALIASILTKGGVDVNKVAVSKTTVRRKKFAFLQQQGK